MRCRVAAEARAVSVSNNSGGANGQAQYSLVIPMVWTEKTMQVQTRLTKAAPWRTSDIAPLPAVIGVGARERAEAQVCCCQSESSGRQKYDRLLAANPCGASESVSGGCRAILRFERTRTGIVSGKTFILIIN